MQAAVGPARNAALDAVAAVPMQVTTNDVLPWVSDAMERTNLATSVTITRHAGVVRRAHSGSSMNKSGGRLLAAAMVFAAAGTAQAQVVISQVYSGTDSNGASAGASYRNSFVELHNNGSTTVDLSSWSVQYRKRLDTGDWQATPLTGLLAPGAYYLVQGAPIAGGLQDLPAADATGSLSFSANEGYVAIANQLGPLNGFCPSWRIDSVILGRADNCAESVSTPIMLDRVTAAIRKDGGCLDSDDIGNFQALPAAPRNRASNAQVCADGGSTPVLRIENGALEEGDEAHNFAVTLPIRLDRPAGYNGVRLRVKTRDGTAIAGRDYTPLDYIVSLPYGSSAGFNVQVGLIPNTEIEPDKTFYLTLSELTGAVPANVEAKGTILNDDFVLTPIHDIQGSGAVSPMVGRLVTTKAVITSLRADGFFLQSLDSQADADPRTSEGIFVHTGAAPDPNWANRYARVTGTVAEYVPLDDPHQSPRTQIGGSPSVTP
ncbi:MAG: lamin tail domain-containing protein, partial [Lysobacter sp.]|nr:lamin tail domain-containing protein [Lysobacter sp.]